MIVCDTKVFYDTEFEATVAAARKTVEHGVEMEPYPCYGHGGVSTPHFHLTHKYINHRRGAGKGFERCPDCSEVYSHRQDHKCTQPTG